MVYVANFCKDLVLRDKTATIRGFGIKRQNCNYQGNVLYL